MAVRIRMKKMGRKHRPFFRICAVDRRAPRDGKVIEELGYYDPMVKETDARAILKSERIDYWLSVGAQPSDRCATLIKKYGTNGSHLSQQTFSTLPSCALHGVLEELLYACSASCSCTDRARQFIGFLHADHPRQDRDRPERRSQNHVGSRSTRSS